ncbi:MAG: hypothetical protein Q7J65_10155 [Candidatus Marinimicrobia bacterium]|nr:hypothetical protein [Candidatus Neomarinimicrobiota bacterium]
MVLLSKKQRITVLSLFLSTLLWNRALHSQTIDNNQGSCFSHYVRRVQNIWDLNYQKNLYITGLVALPISFALDNSLNNYIRNHLTLNIHPKPIQIEISYPL